MEEWLRLERAREEYRRGLAKRGRRVRKRLEEYAEELEEQLRMVRGAIADFDKWIREDGEVLGKGKR